MQLIPLLQRGIRHYLMARGVRSAIAEVGGYPVHHFALDGAGKGPPVLLVHGLGGAATGFFKILFSLASRFRRVHALDLPGNGFSPCPSPALGIREHLGVLAEFSRQVVGAPCFVVGNSLGGALSVSLAHEHPEKVVALGLVAPAGARVDEARLVELFRCLRVQSNQEARALTQRLFHRAPLPALWLSHEVRSTYCTAAVQAILAESRPSDHLDPSVLQQLRVPTVLIWGQSEKLLPYEGVEYFRSHLPPHAQVQVVEGFGHVPQMESPAELVRRLVAFADEHGL
jgi:pimeloyl-ACP methyl ester carboxylesterase